MTIIFWDLPSTVGPWSPNTWKVSRYCLNLKKIPYKTEWVEMPDVAAHCQKLGISPTTNKSDWNIIHALPAIHDLSTGIYLSDSVRIAEYLETQYPDGPQIFPRNTIGLQIDFEDCLNAKLASLWEFVVPPIWHILNPTSQVYYRTTREKAWGKTLEDITPSGDDRAGQWKKVEAGFSGMAVWYSKKSGGGPFMMGSQVSWVDFVVGGHLMWFNKAWRDDDPKWKAIMLWNSGMWTTLL
ncbi:hypothetical protein HYPSUDRAFT_162101, partial [Hypholoma sublateritium FD-334 SS-4]